MFFIRATGSVNPSMPPGRAPIQSDQAHIGINGVALIMECVAAEMGWVSLEQAAVRVNQTLTALAGELPGFLLSRQHQDGWIPTFFSRSTGKALWHGQPYTALDSGLNSAGVLFARTFFVNRRASADKAGFAVLIDNISRLGRSLSVPVSRPVSVFRFGRFRISHHNVSAI